jgi:hypothetical protein
MCLHAITLVQAICYVVETKTYRGEGQANEISFDAPSEPPGIFDTDGVSPAVMLSDKFIGIKILNATKQENRI